MFIFTELLEHDFSKRKDIDSYHNLTTYKMRLDAYLDLFKGLKFLDGENSSHIQYVHSDIKLENIMSQKDKLKFIDLGLVRKKHSLKLGGTWPYMAYEKIF